MEIILEYSQEIKIILQEIGFDIKNYTYEEMFSDIPSFEKHKLISEYSLSPEEGRKIKGYLFYGGITLTRFFDLERKLYVLITERLGSSLEDVEYFLDKNCTIHHREDGPAVFYLRDQQMFSYSWYKNNIKHRDGNLPQSVKCSIDYNSKLPIIFPRKILYRKEGKYSRTNGPAVIMFYIYQTIKHLKWYVDGKKHKENGVAEYIFTQHNKFINLTHKSFWKDNNLHRFDGPAITTKTHKGELKFEHWYVNGKKVDRRKYAYVKDGKLYGNMNKNKKLLINTLLFDREYGQYIREKMSND